MKMKFLGLLCFLVSLQVHSKGLCDQVRAEILRTSTRTSGELLALPFEEGTVYRVGWGYDLRRYRRYENQKPLPFEAEDMASLHSSIDLRVDRGTAVYSLRAGKVKGISDLTRSRSRLEGAVTLQEVLGDGRSVEWSYGHLNFFTIPAKIVEAIKSGETLPAGTHLGNVMPWEFVFEDLPPQIDIMDGKLYDHLDLSLVVDGIACNPMPLLDYEDKEPPTIEQIYFVEPQTNRVLETLTDGGSFRMVIELYDLATDAGTLKPSPFRLHDFKSLKVEVLSKNNDSSVFSNSLDWFDDFKIGGQKISWDFLPQALTLGSGKNLIMEGDTEGRRFFVNLNDGKNALQLPVGSYILHIDATDMKDNRTRKELEFKVSKSTTFSSTFSP